MRAGMGMDGLVYWGFTPQQQPSLYRGGGDDDERSVSLVGETGALEDTTDLREVIRLVSSPRTEAGLQRCEARGPITS